ncbi:MAG: NADH-quinone oxidoreductase subunit J [Cyanobacteria bacterium]|nr:NADH-quinone oxidoreductase subunit J [Cyanobacteriota bacterium]
MDQLDQLQTLLGSEDAESAIFYLVSTLAILFSVGVITDRKVIRSGFLLIGAFGSISVLFLLLQAQFLALAQIMIYAVGITLVVVIALMLTNPRLEKQVEQEDQEIGHEPQLIRWFNNIRKALPAIVALLLFFTVHSAARSEIWDVQDQPVAANNVEVLGRSLTTVYSLPFEFASVLLLAALVGAIMLAKGERRTPPGTEDASEEVALVAHESSVKEG